MNEVLDEIRSRVGAENLGDSCSRDGCQVSMGGVPPRRVVVDADKAFPAHQIEGKRCDFVLFLADAAANTLLAVPIELKGGGVSSVSEASGQLQGGADFVERFAPKDVKSVCEPVLFHRKKIHPVDRDALNRAKIRFRGLRLTIKTARCGRPRNLANVLTIR